MKERLLEAVVREMQIGVLVLDTEKHILYMNPFLKIPSPSKTPHSNKSPTAHREAETAKAHRG